MINLCFIACLLKIPLLKFQMIGKIKFVLTINHAGTNISSYSGVKMVAKNSERNERVLLLTKDEYGIKSLSKKFVHKKKIQKFSI